MQVTSNSNAASDTQTDSTEKKSKHSKSTVTHKSKEHLQKEAAEKAAAEANSPEKANSHEKVEHHEEHKAHEAHEGTGDVQVVLSPKGKAASQGERESKQVDVLLDHIETGKLSKEEHEMAMNRVGEILKKYGKI